MRGAILPLPQYVLMARGAQINAQEQRWDDMSLQV